MSYSAYTQQAPPPEPAPALEPLSKAPVEEPPSAQPEEGPPESVAEPAPPPPTEQEAPVERAGAWALLVDENGLFRQGLRSLLEEVGVAVLGEAGTAEEGERLLSTPRGW